MKEVSVLAKRPGRTREFFAYVKNDPWNWVPVGVVLVALAAIAALLHRYWDKSFWDKWDYADRIVSLATLVVVVLGWCAAILKGVERERQIRIVLKHGSHRRDIPYQPLRAQLSRAELAGILSTYYGKDRFDPAMLHELLSPPDDSESGLSAAIKGTTDSIEIELAEKVYDTFDRFLAGRQAEEETRPAVGPIERRIFVHCGDRYVPPEDEGWTLIELPQELRPQHLTAAIGRVRKAIAHATGARIVVAGPVMLAAALAQALAHDPVPIEYLQLDQFTKKFDVWLTNKQNL